MSMQAIYKICALVGTLIIVADVGFSWDRIQKFEHTVSSVFEVVVTSQMEFDGLQKELSHINKVLAQAGNISDEQKVQIDGVDYSPYEVERLKNERGNIKLYMQEKQLDLSEVNREKTFILNEVRALFLGSLVFLIIGTLLSVFGYLAWYFKIELFEDRRKVPR
ncbi:hypothetical protein MNBD_GAMMA07-909 [hydrothermal vent metagenome]|uniref:Chemotaxis methyl-accepting receptor HlyB-like 4HB MCP domain-containing protein n=1 Tax=hydrothermal vent metagenome TaxID=652676 RepID=A0A3B0XM73_9ZZZZ